MRAESSRLASPASEGMSVDGSGLDRPTAERFAATFRCLADAGRILVLNRLAQAGRPMSVGELVEVVDIGQSTVSHHLRILLDAGFVRVQYVGSSSRFEVNAECLERFPGTAAVILDQALAGAVDCRGCVIPGPDQVDERSNGG
jgi:ArsR family transcriptional regulator